MKCNLQAGMCCDTVLQSTDSKVGYWSSSRLFTPLVHSDILGEKHTLQINKRFHRIYQQMN